MSEHLEARQQIGGAGLGIGDPSHHGERGITKRLDALAGLTDLCGGSLLDVGCGDGAYTVRMADGFDQVSAVDIEPQRLDVFAERIKGTPLSDKIDITPMLAEELSFADDQFDVVTMIEVLEHVADVDRTIANVFRVLKPGGRFLITTPNRLFPIETHGFLVKGKRYAPARGPFLPWIKPLHDKLADARAFTAGGLTKSLEKAGFRRTGLDYMMPPFDQSRVGQRILPVTERIEKSALRVFGMALIVVAEKPRR